MSDLTIILYEGEAKVEAARGNGFRRQASATMTRRAAVLRMIDAERVEVVRRGDV